jgi:hypothetical protein
VDLFLRKRLVMCPLKRICSIAMLLAIAGCGTTSQEIRSAPRQAGEFHLNLPFETVRSNIALESNRCYPGIGTRVSYFYRTVSDRVLGEAATIEVIQDGLARRVAISIDVTKNSRGGTDVSYFVGPPFGLFRDFGNLVRDWSAGAGTCRG